MEQVFTFMETANKYGFPIPILTLLIGGSIWLIFTAKWPERERFYYDLLGSLGRWKNSLSDRQGYYMEPGTEFRDSTISQLPRFKELISAGNTALASIREQVHIGRLFLSKNAVRHIEELIAEHWLIDEFDAICTSDYLDKVLPVVEKVYEAILADARKDLARGRYAALLGRLFLK
ncbi:hypothetical protein ABDD95_12765 [Mucilaginibacter sp. PAMB04274]|uniref:hypothetical protein n=1 Tax=Mucilaginibacter sp. PAMB04274 TaxID=3138568 RepID=UPI0031F718EC